MANFINLTEAGTSRKLYVNAEAISVVYDSPLPEVAFGGSNRYLIVENSYQDIINMINGKKTDNASFPKIEKAVKK